MLRYARHATSAAGAKLSIIHAIEATEAQFGVQGPSEVEQVARQRVAELQRAVGSQASADVAVGGIKEVLLQVVRQSAADVLVIGRSLRAVLWVACGILRIH